MEKVVSIQGRLLKQRLEERLEDIREKQSEMGVRPVAQIAGRCPVCQYPFSAKAHGWVKDYSEHSEHSGHHRKYGYCEVACPACAGDAQARLAAHLQAELVARLFGGANIPFQARTWTLASYPANADQAALQAVQDFVRRHLAGDDESKRGLFLGGQSGRCKTSLAIAALKTVLEAGHPGLFVMAVELMMRIQATYRGGDIGSDELLDAVVSVPWLVLDDLGVEQRSPDVLKHLYYIVSKRLQDGLYTIFTSNLSTSDLETLWRPAGTSAGEFHAGVRVIERIKEMCQGVAVQSRNIRAEGVRR